MCITRCDKNSNWTYCTHPLFHHKPFTKTTKLVLFLQTSLRSLTCFLHISGQDCQGPIHQCEGQGSSLHVLANSSSRSSGSHRMLSTVFNMPLVIGDPPSDFWQIGTLSWIPPPQVTEHCDQSPKAQEYRTCLGLSDFESVNLYLIPGFLVSPRNITC